MRVIICAAILAASQLGEVRGDDSPSEPFSAASQYSTRLGGYSVLVHLNGETVFESYSNGSNASQAHNIDTGAMSFWALVLGAMIQDKIATSYHERVSDTIAEWKDDPQKSTITVAQLLNHSSGLEGGWQKVRRISEIDAYKIALNAEIINPVGRKFEFSVIGYYVLGEWMKRKLAAREEPFTIQHYVTQRLFDPIKVKVAKWTVDAKGNPSIPRGMHLTASSWAQWGELIRQQGMLEDLEVVNPKTVRFCIQCSANHSAYGLGFWILKKNRPRVGPPRPFARGIGQSDPEVIMATGSGAQRLYIIESLNLVIVRQGRSFMGYEDEEFLKHIYDDLERARENQAALVQIEKAKAPPGEKNEPNGKTAATLKDEAAESKKPGTLRKILKKVTPKLPKIIP